MTMVKQKNIQKIKNFAAISIWNKTNLIYMAIIGLVIMVIYSSAFHNQLTNWDDDYYITKNSTIHKLDWVHIQKIFKNILTDTYCPLTALSFAVEYHFFKLNSFPYIFNNILLHIAVSVLIFIFALKIGLNQRAAFLGALLFAVHPTKVESVAWITERKDVLYAFFYMLAIHQHIQYIKTDRKFSYFLSLFFGLLSILSKAMALSLPLVLLVCDWVMERKINRRALLEKIPYFLYIIPIAALTFMASKKVPMTNLVEGGMIWIWSFVFYFKKFFWPVTLVPIYSVPKPIGFQTLDYNIAVIVFFVIIGFFIYFYKNKWFRFALLYFFFSIFFMIRVAIEKHSSPVADRFMYLPSLGLCLLLGYFFEITIRKIDFKSKVRAFVLVAFLIILYLTLAFKSYDQVKVWKDSESLWKYTVKYTRTSTIYNNLGQVYYDKKDFDKAMMYYDKVIKIQPEHEIAYFNKALIYEKRNQYDLAINHYNEALKRKPTYQKAHVNKCGVYIKTKKYDLAIKSCDKALEIDSEYALAYQNRAVAYFNLKKYSEAWNNVQKAKEFGFPVRDKFLEDIRKNLPQK